MFDVPFILLSRCRYCWGKIKIDRLKINLLMFVLRDQVLMAMDSGDSLVLGIVLPRLPHESILRNVLRGCQQVEEIFLEIFGVGLDLSF